jgi:hypothetical protein
VNVQAKLFKRGNSQLSYITHILFKFEIQTFHKKLNKNEEIKIFALEIQFLRPQKV